MSISAMILMRPEAHGRGQLQPGYELAVDAQADAHRPGGLRGLDVDVGGPVLDGVGDETVHQPHERVVRLRQRHAVVAGLQRRAGAELGGQAVQVLAMAGSRRTFGRCARARRPVGLGNGRRQGARRGHHGLHLQVGQEAQPRQQIGIQRIGHRHHERVLAQQQRQHALALGQGLWHLGDGLGLRRQLARIDHPHAHPLQRGLLQLGRRQRSGLHQHRPE
jgi:hypothetical protein